MNDNVTVTKKKIGRPAAGIGAMSQVERKRVQRQRDRAAITDAIGEEENAPIKALLGLLARLDKGEYAERSAQRAWREIGRRMQWIA